MYPEISSFYRPKAVAGHGSLDQCVIY